MNCREIRDDLFERMVKQNFRGIDWSSVIFSEKVIAINNKLNSLEPKYLKKVLISVFYRLLNYGGYQSVKIIKPKELIFSKGLALILSGLSLQNTKSKGEYIEQITALLLMKKLPNQYLWAHDIDYTFPDGTIVTTSTPNLVTTAFVANAFWDLYQNTNNERWKEMFIKITSDVLKFIPYKEIDSCGICFMYTPVTNFYVHNANLLYAEIVSKYLYLMPEQDNSLIALLSKSINYSLNDFASTGSFPYAGPPTINHTVDNYHTGYVLRSILEISRYSPEISEKYQLDSVVSKLFEFYKKNFIKKYVIHSKSNMIESHSLAESILVYCSLSDRMVSIERKHYLNVVRRTINLLWDQENKYFINNIKQLFMFKVYDKTEMIRWSNAWMFFALSMFIAKSGDV